MQFAKLPNQKFHHICSYNTSIIFLIDLLNVFYTMKCIFLHRPQKEVRVTFRRKIDSRISKMYSLNESTYVCVYLCMYACIS